MGGLPMHQGDIAEKPGSRLPQPDRQLLALANPSRTGSTSPVAFRGVAGAGHDHTPLEPQGCGIEDTHRPGICHVKGR